MPGSVAVLAAVLAVLMELADMAAVTQAARALMVALAVAARTEDRPVLTLGLELT